jgi:hypothetical protein
MYIMTTNGWRPLHVATVNHNQLTGVFSPVSGERAAAENASRASAYAKDVAAHINGNLGKDEVFRSFHIPVYGAFGEKL